MKRRVVITGMGIVSALGFDIDEFYSNLLNGKSAVSRIERFDASEFSVQIAGEIKGFNPLDWFDRNEAKRMDRFCQYGMVAARKAMEASNIDLGKIDKERFGVITGCGIGGMETFESNHEKLIKKGNRRVSPLFIPMMISDMLPGRISIAYGLKGVNYSITSACASSGHAIGAAMKAIRYDEADLMIAGGAEAVITEMAVAGFGNMKATSRRNDEPEKASRPFDIDRNGFVMGEGSAIFVLEELEHALKRGATIYAEIAGMGASADAYDMVMPDEEGRGGAQAMRLALKDAGMELNEIDHINTHGTSTPRGDIAETIAIKDLFGDHAQNIAVNSTKSMIGHLLGAAGAVELVGVVKSVMTDTVHPTINLDNQDPQCDLNYVPNHYIEKKVDAALCNTFGFGGHNASILIKKYKG